MRTSHTWARGLFAVDYEDRLDPGALRRGRIARAQEAMRAADLDALLVWKDENVRYLTGHRPQLIAGKSGLLNGVLATQGGECVLFVSGGDYDRASEAMPWIAKFQPIPILEEAGLITYFVDRVLRDVLTRLGLTSARIGIDLASQALHLTLRERLPKALWEDGDAVMQRARRVKLPEELALIEEATAIAEAVTQSALEAVAPGVRELDVAGEAMRTLYRMGGEYAHVTTPFVASGERMAPPTRLATDKIIRHGDLVFVDIGAMVNGYFADVGRTVVCGRPSSEQQRIYQAVHDAHQMGLQSMRPGITTREVAERIRAEARRHGLDQHFLNLFIGHGIGTGSNEPPYVGEPFPGAEEVVLEPGMVFAMEPLIWIPNLPGGGGVRLEDMVLVTEQGRRVISRLPYDERLLAHG